jgi:hypothetical protein
MPGTLGLAVSWCPTSRADRRTQAPGWHADGVQGTHRPGRRSRRRRAIRWRSGAGPRQRPDEHGGHRQCTTTRPTANKAIATTPRTESVCRMPGTRSTGTRSASRPLAAVSRAPTTSRLTAALALLCVSSTPGCPVPAGRLRGTTARVSRSSRAVPLTQSGGQAGPLGRVRVTGTSPSYDVPSVSRTVTWAVVPSLSRPSGTTTLPSRTSVEHAPSTHPCAAVTPAGSRTTRSETSRRAGTPERPRTRRGPAAR